MPPGTHAGRRSPLQSAWQLLGMRLAGLLAAWAAAVLIVAWLVYAGRQVAFERGERATMAFASVVEQQVERTFQTIYLTLGAIGDAQQLGAGPPKNDPDFRNMMVRRLGDVPFVRALFIIDRSGWIIHDTDYPNTPAVSLADRPYFQAYVMDPSLGAHAWPPVQSRSGTGWFLPVTRPLRRNGGLEGLAVAAVQARHFEEQFIAAGLPEGYLVTLFHTDGTLLASYPALSEDIGRNFAHLPMFAELSQHRPAGSFWTEAGLMPGRRVVSYRMVPGVPYVVRVSRGTASLLAEWRRTATGAVVAMLALTVFSGWLVMRLVRDNARRARERERRAQIEKLEALGQLSGGMAHDFANLLTVVGMNVAALRSGAGGAEGAEQSLAALDRTVRNGRTVIDRLLAFARRRPLALSRVRLEDWLDAARPLLENAAGGRVRLTLKSERPLPEVLCDVGELDVALVNLLVNARDAMAGSGEASVTIAREPPEFVRVTVADDGPGMTEEVRRRALEPFYTTKGEAGTGLGLSQVYGFLQQLGGHVAIDSAPGKGTRVHLFIPVAPAAQASPQ